MWINISKKLFCSKKWLIILCMKLLFMCVTQKHNFYFQNYDILLIFVDSHVSFPEFLLIFCIIETDLDSNSIGQNDTWDVVVVYQCSFSNVIYTGDIEALFVLVHAVLWTHPLLRGTYQIITSPWPGLAGSHTLWHSHINAYGECAGGPWASTRFWPHDFWMCMPCVTTMLYSPCTLN